MAIELVPLPKCDVCGEIWLPDKKLPGGGPNPARKHPELSKRCGKCKTPRWNYKAKQAAKDEARKKSAEAATKRTAEKLEHPAVHRKQKLCRHRVLNCPICKDRD